MLPNEWKIIRDYTDPKWEKYMEVTTCPICGRAGDYQDRKGIKSCVVHKIASNNGIIWEVVDQCLIEETK